MAESESYIPRARRGFPGTVGALPHLSHARFLMASASALAVHVVQEFPNLGHQRAHMVHRIAWALLWSELDNNQCADLRFGAS